ncbi:MAG TPA: cyanophycinase [Longimicrobiales bacterium]
MREIRSPAGDAETRSCSPATPRARRVAAGRPVLVLTLALAACAGAVQDAGRPAVGPPNGTLILAGGGSLGPEIWARFVELAGGPAARIVVIPTASERDSFPEDWGGLQRFREAGVADVRVLHTRDTTVANTEAFVAPLREATGVWIPGGRQWRLADAYLGTRVLDELWALLERGGVIGGTSAGASIQPSYMVRGAPEGNRIVMAEGHERGFGFLKDVAVDQHLITRGRERDLLSVIERYPDLLGIGLDEGTAIVVRGDTAEVIGRSKVAVYNAPAADDDADDDAPYFWLEPGDRFDLAARRVIERAGAPAPSPAGG